jgi:hypothetical protein
MTKLAEIEAAIEQLPAPELDELAQWIEQFRGRKFAELDVDQWLSRARGAALPEVTTEGVMNLTRGES